MSGDPGSEFSSRMFLSMHLRDTAQEWGTLVGDALYAMKVRRSLILGAAFALLLAIIAGSAVSVWRKTIHIQENIASLNRAHKEAGDALTRIKSGVYLAGVLLRDSLLDPDPSSNPEYVEQFERIRSDAGSDLRKLEAFMPDEQQRHALDLLHSELKVYWAPAETALELSPEERVARRMQLLRQRVRKRQEIFEITARVEELLAANFAREQQRMDRAQQELKSWLAWSTGTALALGFMIAAFTLVRLLVLERKSDFAASELRRLSNSLRLAQEEERKYLSRELHDQIGQMLTALRMELAAVTPGSEGEPLRAQIDRARGTVEQTLKTVRTMAMLLRPSMLDDLGLGPALSWQAKEFSRLTGITADVAIDNGVDELPDQHRTCLYRVIQEALTNCARHSKARRVSVIVRKGEHRVTASVSDDGVGFSMEKLQRRGLGLLGMEERVRELNGQFSVSSQPGTGTRIDISIPTGPESEDEHKNPDSGRPWHRTRRVEASA